MAQMYGNIINGVQPNIAGVNVAHGLRTTSYCVFGTQRITADVKQAPRLYCPVGASRAAAQCVLHDAATVGPLNRTTMDILPVTEHSLVDIGPVVTGAVRNATTQVRNNRRAYRSLHTQVPIDCKNGAPLGSVDVVHRLNSVDVLKFVFPNEDPWDAGGASLHFWCTVVDPNTIRVNVARQDGANFAGVLGEIIRVDVMIMTGVAVGHSMPLVPMLTGAGLPGGTGDYVAGDRPSLTRRPSYWAAYHPLNVAAGPAAAYAHNLRTAPTMVLIGPTLPQAAVLPNDSAFVGAWTPNVAAPTLNVDLQDAGAGNLGLNGNCVLVLSPYSPLAVAYP